MKFCVSTADPFGIMTMWKGSLHVDHGPYHSEGRRRRTRSLAVEPSRRSYGMFAFRDVRNSQERNFIFEYPRDRPFKLKPGSDKLQPLIHPPQGIYAVGPVIMEYHLMIKNQEGEEARVLVDGYSIYCPSLYEELSRFHWHIDTSHYGAIDLKMAAVPNAMLATVEIEVICLGGTHYDSLAIVSGLEMFKGKLRPFTVCINRERHLKLFVYGYSSSQIGHGNCSPDGVHNLEDMDVSVMIF
uniref:DUF6598 domain-containing protein n=1 Tax=Oryza punctata TaxID=4537 RepID=A0A0E0L829_ORYPU